MVSEIKSVSSKQFGRAFEAEGFSRTSVQLPGNGIEFLLSKPTQVGPLGKVLPEQTIGVFVDPSLPGAVRVGKVNLHAGGRSQALVLSHLLALIVGQRKALLRLDAIEYMTESTECRLGTGILHPGQHSEQCRAFYQRANRRTVERPFDEVTLPVSRHQTFFNIRRSVMNADHVWNTPTPIFTARSRTTLGMPKTQPANYFRAQLTAWHRVNGGVDGFVRNLQGWRIRMHKRQCASNLLRRVPGFQVVADALPQRCARSEPTLNSWFSRAGMGTLMRSFVAIPASHQRTPLLSSSFRLNPTVSTQLTRKCRSRTTQPHCDGCRLDSHLQLRLDHRPFFYTQLLVHSSHATFSPDNVALGF